MRALAFRLWTVEVDERSLVAGVVDNGGTQIALSGRIRRGPSQRDPEFLAVTLEL